MKNTKTTPKSEYPLKIKSIIPLHGNANIIDKELIINSTPLLFNNRYVAISKDEIKALVGCFWERNNFNSYNILKCDSENLEYAIYRYNVTEYGYQCVPEGINNFTQLCARDISMDIIVMKCKRNKCIADIIDNQQSENSAILRVSISAFY